MTIEWVNHASFVLVHENIRLLSDPWIEGRVFNQSWALLAPSKFRYEDFGRITHLWFSHEHPDHFFPPNLKKIPEEYRRQITVLYQYTKDKKVVGYCKKLGFKHVVELEPYKPYLLGDKLTITNAKVANDTDSWLYIKSPTCRVLNLNDCVFKAPDLLKLGRFTGKVDVLLTQFSFANWIGNEGDHEGKRAHARQKMLEIKRNIATFKPTYTIPFASFVWFCHKDNYHFNAYANPLSEVVREIAQKGSTPVVLYPGDQWAVGFGHDTQRAMARYAKDVASIPQRQLTTFETVPLGVLKESAQKNIEKSIYNNSKTKLFSYRPMFVYLTDYGEVFSFSYSRGLSEVPGFGKELADISFHSQNFKYCLDFDWGYDSILVAGTFEKPAKGNFQNFMEYEWVSNLNNQGKRMRGLFGRLAERLASIA